MKTILCLVIVLGLSANSNALDEVAWWTVAGGGATGSQSQFTLAGTLGQPVASRTQSKSVTLTGGFWSYGFSLAAQSAPNLRVTLEGRHLRLAWPDWAEHYQLQTTANLETPAWRDVSQQPVRVSSEFQVTLSPQGGSGYFRLLSRPAAEPRLEVPVR